MSLIYSLYIINKSGGLIFSRVRRRALRVLAAAGSLESSRQRRAAVRLPGTGLPPRWHRTRRHRCRGAVQQALNH